MAERVVRQLIDDIDGSEIPDGAGERVVFSLRGTEYQIDLSNSNLAKFEKALKPYVEAGSKLRGRGVRRVKSVGSTGPSGREQLAAIRDWARSNGYEVSDRGRIKAEVVEAFEAAH
ncbi:Lsr2 family protein [Mycolicibacterium sp. 120266]|uniref:histone-like nucleoid-structuring protein Lsr2 n=1 Tax=Mycolicibacterium sp. 120266 TaxID=3090601 RepID=UPI00299E85D4|nr:Lsr2 family protein [Mycolicibacterium sp. 120266]MDX1876084.1 Lsr2 family protein [Mycolicibacterium sp. 120266]